MSTRRILNVLKNEWRVLRGQTDTILLMALVPVLLLAQVLLIIWLVDRFGGQTIVTNSFFNETLNAMARVYPGAAGLDDIDRVRLLLLTQVNMYALLIPTMVAIYAGAYGIVEEKVSRSLEPLLATPVRTWELLLGKALAGFIPAMIITWCAAALSLLGITILGWGYLIGKFIGITWLMNFLVVSPAIAMLSFLLGIIGSSWAKDHKSAQNLVMFIIFPVFLLIGLQVTGLVAFTSVNISLFGVGLIIIDILVLRIAVRLFRRESIILRWR